MTRLVTHPITRFLARRLAYSAVVMIGVLIVVFALVHLVPGIPCASRWARATPHRHTTP